MGLHLGNSGIKKVYLGNNEVSKIYLGLDLVYQNRPVGIPIEGAPNGAYILRNDNLLYSEELWDSKWNNEAVGIAVIDSKHPNGGFVISKEGDNTERVWSTSGKYITGIMTTPEKDTAKTDYLGESNTDKAIEQDSPACETVIYCRNYTFPNGKKGYLGAVGEWQIAFNNKSVIDSCLVKINGFAINNRYHWSSTQWSDNGAWSLYWSTGAVGAGPKTGRDYVRAFCALK